MKGLIKWWENRRKEEDKKHDSLRSEDERKAFIESLDQSENVQNFVNYRNVTNAAFSVAYATLGGMALSFGNSFVSATSYSEYAVEDRISDDDPSLEDKNTMLFGFLGCVVAGLVLERVQLQLSQTFFKPIDVADLVKVKLEKLSFDQMQKALENCDNDNLQMIRVPKLDVHSDLNKFNLKYFVSGLVTGLSPIPEDKKYLLFTVVRGVSGFLLDLLEKRILANQVDPVMASGASEEDSVMIRAATNAGLSGEERARFEGLSQDQRESKKARLGFIISELDPEAIKEKIALDLTSEQWQLLSDLTDEQRQQIRIGRHEKNTVQLFSDNFLSYFSDLEKQKLSKVLAENMERLSQEYSDPKRILSEVVTYLAFSLTLHYSPVSSQVSGKSPDTFAAINGGDFGVSSAVLHSVKIAKNNIEQKWRDYRKEVRVEPGVEILEVPSSSFQISEGSEAINSSKGPNQQGGIV